MHVWQHYAAADASGRQLPPAPTPRVLPALQAGCSYGFSNYSDGRDWYRMAGNNGTALLYNQVLSFDPASGWFNHLSSFFYAGRSPDKPYVFQLCPQRIPWPPAGCTTVTASITGNSDPCAQIASAHGTTADHIMQEDLLSSPSRWRLGAGLRHRFRLRSEFII